MRSLCQLKWAWSKIIKGVRVISSLHVCTGAIQSRLLFSITKIIIISSDGSLSFLSSAVTVSFDRLSYTVAENETLEVCIMFRGALEYFLELNISLLSDSAGSKLDYCVVCIVEYMYPIGLC